MSDAPKSTPTASTAEQLAILQQQDARLAAMEATLTKLIAHFAHAPVQAPAVVTEFVPLSRDDYDRLSPQQKVQYMAACNRAAHSGKSGSPTPAVTEQRALSQTKYDAHKVNDNTSLFCPKCGFSFRHHDSAGGKAVGGTGGAAAGAALGAKIGIAAGPLGAIAGTVPGAILGAVFGAQAGNHLDKPQCPRCGTSFSLSSSKPEKGFVEIFKETYTKEREKFKKARDPNDESYREAIKNLLQKRGDVNLKDYSISKFIFLTDAEMKQLNQEHQLKYTKQAADAYRAYCKNKHG